VLATAAGACVMPRPALAAAPLRFGLTPVFLTSDTALLSGLESYLSRSCGRPVELVQRRTYQEITALLLSQQLDAAWICGFPYVKYRDQLNLLAIPAWRGRPLYQSYLIVGRDRPATRVEDLAGDIHAFSDPDSNSGYLATAALLVERQATLDSFFRKHFYTYGHRNVVRAVASGLAESGSVDGYVWEVMQEIEPELANGTRVLHRSDWLGFPPVASAAELASAAGTRALAASLLRMGADPDGSQVLALLRLDGFVAPRPGLYRGIAERWRQVSGMS
jgi:phosphonate transport system substrate-binding protein